MSFNSSFAYNNAITIVTAALSSKSVELLGPSSLDEKNKENAKKDAEYLNFLITSVAENILASPKGST